MGVIQTIRIFLGVILFLALGINFFYRGIKSIRRIHQSNYAKDTLHTFQCRKCEEIYQMDGEEAKSRISIWATRLEKKTPSGQTTAIRFECPECHNKTFQNQIFDTNVTALAGNIRVQMTESSRAILIDLLVKGFLPIIIGMPILSVLLP